MTAEARAAAADAPAPALQLEDVTHSYGETVALRDVDLRLEMGEVMCLVGPSGCGKSTALRLAAGLETVQHGRVSIAGAVVADDRRQVPPEDRNVGLVFQDYALFPHMTVQANVEFGLERGGARVERARAALRSVGMAELAQAYPHTLSGGEQQRVALARALAPRPGVLLLDEPFSGLDRRLREEVRDQTLHVLKQSGAATLMVTHDPEEAMFMSDRIAVMRDGAVVQAGPPVDLYRHPSTPFVAGFLGEVNEFGARLRGGSVDSPLGPLPAGDALSGAADGTEVRVLVRSEGVIVDPAAAARVGHGAPRSSAKVVAARVLGRTSLVHLSVPADGAGLHMHARVPGTYPPAEGETVPVWLDQTHVFVFPVDLD